MKLSRLIVDVNRTRSAQRNGDTRSLNAASTVYGTYSPDSRSLSARRSTSGSSSGVAEAARQVLHPSPEPTQVLGTPTP